MRSLQRLRHQRPLAPREVTHVQKTEGSAIAKRQAGLRRKRALRLLLGSGVLAIAVLVLHNLLSSRSVVRGVVRTDMEVIRAPARVRVEKVLVVPGQGCEPGDLLLQLSALDVSVERKVLELEVERSAKRVLIAAAGGVLGTTDLNRRQEMLSDARVQLRVAEAAARQASAEWQALVRQRARTEIELAQEKIRSDQSVATLEARTEELQAQADSFGAERVLAELGAEQGAELHSEGIVSEYERIAAEVGSRIAQKEWQGASVSLEAAQAELANAASLNALEGDRGEAVLLELDARIAAAQRALELELARRTLWEEVAQERGALLPENPSDAGTLRDLELAMLRIESETAQAKLAAFDARVGNALIHATLRGVVDAVLVREGSIVEAGEVLLRTFDPGGLHVEGYLEPGSEAFLHPGAECTIVPDGGNWSLRGEVSTVASTWEPCPLALLVDGLPEASPRLPFDVQPMDGGEAGGKGMPLRPGMLVRLVFER